MWICPVRPLRRDVRFDLYPMDPGTLYVNFGFWDVIRERQKRPDGHYNRQVERKVSELDGIKSLYSDSYYTSEEFSSLYNRTAYEALKRKYDPGNRLRDLYDKCVVKA